MRIFQKKVSLSMIVLNLCSEHLAPDFGCVGGFKGDLNLEYNEYNSEDVYNELKQAGQKDQNHLRRSDR
jgi:hypothetical protein